MAQLRCPFVRLLDPGLDMVISSVCEPEDGLRGCGVDVSHGRSLTEIRAFWTGYSEAER